ncbi:MAG TPA: glutamate--tRNA ligase, partial [Paraburkholderia sp.]
EALAGMLSDPVRAGLGDLRAALQALPEWRREAISAAFKATLAQHQLKMPQLAMPVRLLVAGQTQTPAIDAVLELFGRETVMARLRAASRAPL